MSNAPAKNNSSLLATLVRTIRTDCLHRAVDQTMTSPSGKPLEWSFDLRPLLLDGSALELIADSFWNRFEREAPFQVCGLELTAVPLLTAIIMAGNTRKRPVTGLIVRKERKPYGLVRKIEGTLTCRPIIVVDDLVNSGTSLEKVRAALGEVGRTISTVFTILDFRAARGIDWRERHNIAITSLFTLRDFGLSLATQAELVCPQYSNRSRERPGCFRTRRSRPGNSRNLPRNRRCGRSLARRYIPPKEYGRTARDAKHPAAPSSLSPRYTRKGLDRN